MRSRMIRWALPFALLAVAGVGASMAASASTRSSGVTLKTAMTAKYGAVLVSSSGKVLYRFTPDTKGVNTCTRVAACAKFWPRLLAKGTAKPTVGGGAKASLVGTIEQPKGLRQVTYAGFPLYFFAGDKKAGDTNGQGLGKKWYVVDTAGKLVKKAVSGGGAAPPAPAPAPAPTAGGGGGGGGGAWG